MRETMFSTLVLVVSSVMSCLCVGFYWNRKDNVLQLTYAKPFSDWGGVRDAFYALEGRNSTRSPTVMAAAWCNKPSFRPGVTADNRSESCRCLSKRVTRLLNETGVLFNASKVFPRDAVRQYGSDSVGCLAYRGVWDIWPCEGGCKVHPLVLAFTCNFIYVLLSLGFLLGMESSYSYITVVNFLVATLGSVILLVIDPAANALYCVVFAWIALAFQFVVKDEVFSYAGVEVGQARTPGFSPPAPFMVCFWLGFAFTTPILTVYLASSQLVRDLIGIITYGWVGYFAGLMAQRMFWVKWYVGEWFFVSQEVTGDLLVRRSFGTMMWYALFFGQLGLWFAVAMLSITQWYDDSPYASSAMAFVLLLAQFTIALLEMFNSSYYSVKFEFFEMAQVVIMLGINVSFTIVGIVDTMR